MIDVTDRVPRRTFRVADQEYSVAFAGDGPPVVFLHGSVAHVYAWRNIIPYLAARNRCLAPDLAGMGRSAAFRFNLASYSFSSQYSGAAELIHLLEPERPVVIVGHELGAMMAARFAQENPGSVAGLVFLEGAFRISNDRNFPADVQEFLAAYVQDPKREDVILGDNLLVEFYINRLTSRFIGPEEMSAYRRPYEKSLDSRRAMLSMIRELPLKSRPGPIDELAERIRVWCSQSETPKLVIGGDPGFLVPGPVLSTTAKWANTTTAKVHGLHFLTEDSPARLTSLLLDWLTTIGHTEAVEPVETPDEVETSETLTHSRP